RLRERRLAHERGAALARHHLLGRAAHVDVDEARAHRHRRGRPPPHFLLATAKKLHAQGTSAARGRALLQRLFRATRDGGGGKKLGDGQAYAHLLADGAEGQIGDRGHGREQHRWIDAKGTYGKHNPTILRPNRFRASYPDFTAESAENAETFSLRLCVLR